jgi:hypothetical protein
VRAGWRERRRNGKRERRSGDKHCCYNAQQKAEYNARQKGDEFLHGFPEQVREVVPISHSRNVDMIDRDAEMTDYGRRVPVTVPWRGSAAAWRCEQDAIDPPGHFYGRALSEAGREK